MVTSHGRVNQKGTRAHKDHPEGIHLLPLLAHVVTNHGTESGGYQTMSCVHLHVIFLPGVKGLGLADGAAEYHTDCHQ